MRCVLLLAHDGKVGVSFIALQPIGLVSVCSASGHRSEEVSKEVNEEVSKEVSEEVSEEA
jgi:hypothetical protein